LVDVPALDGLGVEHLNYKRLTPGTKILARIHSVLNLHLILSLPNQLLAHVPITEISNSLTHLLTKDEKDSNSDISMKEEESDSDDEESSVPELHQLFRPGQYVLTTLTQSFVSESSNKAFLTLYPPSEAIRLASRLEMSLVPEKVNKEVSRLDVVKGESSRVSIASAIWHANT
jgi:rRNA biogenesis protein RRP5